MIPRLALPLAEYHRSTYTGTSLLHWPCVLEVNFGG